MNDFEQLQERLKKINSNSGHPIGQKTPFVPAHSNGPDRPPENEKSDDVYLSQEEMNMGVIDEKKR
jgi:hypothetical protein